MDEAPGQAGYRLPGEFEPHEATWLAWPHDERTWIEGLEPARKAFCEMIEALSQGERVDLIIRPKDREDAEQLLSTRSLGDLRLHETSYADSWLRDTGPTVLAREEDRLAIDWRFDAWGGKYEDLEQDDALAAFIAKQAGLARHRVDAVMEGGAIDANGQSLLLTTEDCLLQRGHESKADVEALFARVLGVEETIWLRGGLAGDDTDGHVDTVARFLDENTIAIPTTTDEHPDGAILAANERRLDAIASQHGLDVLELPHPEPIRADSQPRPATYANLYIGNEVVLLPVYDDPSDAEAAQRLDDAFPARRIVEIDARALVAGYGACHCLTKQIPTLTA